MSGFTTAAPDYLVRAEVWSTQLKDILLDELMAQKYVNWMSEFPDGDTFTIPSLGEFEVFDVIEDQSVRYSAADTGEFQFTINKYKGSATYITEKQKQDSFYASQITGSFLTKESRALMVALETDILALANSQTNDDSNTINGAKHRFVGTGTSQTISIEDFSRARYALKKANVPDTNLVAIVCPEVAHELDNLPNINNLTNNPMWEGIVSTGITTGMKFIRNIKGFDVYVSNYLPDANETIDGVTTAAGKANLFFSAASDVLPFIGAIRQAPKVDTEYNKDYQREEFVTTMRYGVKLYRPENLVCVLTDTDQVYA